MNDAEQLAEHLRSAECVLLDGVLTRADLTVTCSTLARLLANARAMRERYGDRSSNERTDRSDGE